MLALILFGYFQVSVFIQYEQETKFLVGGKLKTGAVPPPAQQQQQQQTGMLIDFDSPTEGLAPKLSQPCHKNSPPKSERPPQESTEGLIMA